MLDHAHHDDHQLHDHDYHLVEHFGAKSAEINL